MSENDQRSGDPATVVELRTLVVAGQPLAVVSEHAGEASEPAGVVAHSDTTPSSWWRRLADSGLPRVDALLGAELPRGARVGFSLQPDVLRLVDEADTTLLRAAREGLDDSWLQVVRRRKGTMLVVVQNVDLNPEFTHKDLLPRIDEATRRQPALGAIVGVVEERPQLPLMFG